MILKGTAIWEKIVGVVTSYAGILKGTAIWEDYGTILWSWRNQPWLSSFPWLEKGGAKPITTYSEDTKPTTSYQSTTKPTTNYTNIDKPNG